MVAERQNDSPQRRTALLIGLPSLVGLFLMGHHPTHTDSGWNRIVHGGLIVVLAIQWVGFLGLADVLGPRSFRARAALVAQAIAVAWLSGAALVNGFLVAHLLHEHGEGHAANHKDWSGLLELCHSANQTLAIAGSIALGASFALWSTLLVTRPGLAKVVGGFGLVVGVLTSGMLLVHHLELDVHGMMLVVIGQTMWNLGVATWLFRASRSVS